MEDGELLGKAIGGDRVAFDRLVRPLLPGLRSFAYRMVAHPEDADDVLQDALLRAYRGVADFRGDSTLKTWIFGIATRVAIDHLQSRNRWKVGAQIEGERLAKATPAELAPIEAALSAPDSSFDVREHIAFCFTCVAHALPVPEQAALLLVEVAGFTYREAAKIVAVSEAVLRHRLSAARSSMVEQFDGLCALVNKNGACYQCNVLRDAAPPDRRGPPVQPIGLDEQSPASRLDERLRIAREADLDGGPSHRLHDALLRLLTRMAEGS